MILSLLRTLATLISIYTLLCTIRILLTWIPGMQYNRFVATLNAICDPYLRLFSSISWLRFGALDFSPILGLSLLVLTSSMLENIAASGKFSLGMFLAMFIVMIRSVAASLITFLLIILIIRLIVALMKRDNSRLWTEIDYTLNPIVSSIGRFFSGRRPVSYVTTLVLSIIVVVFIYMTMQFALAQVIRILSSLGI